MAAVLTLLDADNLDKQSCKLCSSESECISNFPDISLPIIPDRVLSLHRPLPRFQSKAFLVRSC